MKKLLVLLALAAVALPACAHTVTPHAVDALVVAPAKAQERLPTPRLLAALGSKMLPASRDSVVIARLTLDSESDAKVARPPLNVALCIDTSGSMDGKAIEDARKAAQTFLDGLRPGDGFSVVTFDSTARVVVPATHLRDKAELADVRKSIDGIHAEGTTDMVDGLSLAVQQVEKLYDASRVNRVVLLGDGVPNDASRLRTIAQQAAGRGVSISTVGLGLDYDEILMGDIAQTAGGRFEYVDDSSKIASYFAEELSHISRVSARQARVRLSPGPGVTIEGVIGFPVSPAGAGAVDVYVGDLSLGTRRDLFVKMRVHGRRDGASVELADATLSFTASDGTPGSDHVFLGAHSSGEDAKVAAGRDASVEHDAKKAQQAADAIEAIRKARESDRASSGAAGLGGGGGVKRPVAPRPPPMAPAQVKREHAAAMSTLMGE